MELTSFEKTPIAKLKDSFAVAKYDPSFLTKAQLSTVDQILSGTATFVDASSPAVMLLEMSAVQSANAVQESIALYRKQYPQLAMNMEQLYPHMCDEDYLNRFASPSNPTTIGFALQLNDFIREAVYDESEEAYKVIVPRDTSIVVDKVSFMTLYPIVIRRYSNGLFQVTYDADIFNPFFGLNQTIIDHTEATGTNLEKWIIFTVNVLQVACSTTYATIDKSYNFKKNVSYSDYFYYARVFYKNNNTGNNWVEISTSHTDQVFDPTKPTALLQVLETSVDVRIPVIYTTTGKVSGEVRVDLYTTKGPLSLNLGNYRQDNYVVDMKTIDDIRDTSVYSEAMKNISFYVFSREIINSGEAPVSFEALRERVIFNALGEQVLPITSVQIDIAGIDSGFEIVRNVDTITNRIFLATKKLPTPSIKKLVTPANVGIVTFVSDLEKLSSHYKAVVNGDRTTLLSKAICKLTNGIASLLSKSETDALLELSQTALVEEINSGQYFYTPFHYVLDAGGEEFELRPYALDAPYAKDQNFVRQNKSLQLVVNTSTYELKKMTSGYSLFIKTKSSNHYKNLQDSEVAVQLAFNPKGESSYAYINGTLSSKTADNERIFRFDIATNYDIDGSDLLCITNAQVNGVSNYQAYIDLETEFNIIHSTNQPTVTFVADKTDTLVGKFLLGSEFVGNTHEKLTLHFGDSLKYLWKRSRSFSNTVTYRTYDADIPLLYEEDIFDKDPVTGASFSVVNGEVVYRYQHRRGDPVLDTLGNPVYKFKKGDVFLDENENPVADISSSPGRELDILVVDAKYFYADDVANKNYRSEIESTLTSWIINDVSSLQGKLLDQSKIFFYPKTTLGTIQVVADNKFTDYIDAEQSFVVELYVKSIVYNNDVLREDLKRWTIEALDGYISRSVINMTEVRSILKSVYGDSVSAFSIKGLGGEKDYQYLKVVDDGHSVCLKKRLSIQADKKTIVEAAVSIEFKKID